MAKGGEKAFKNASGKAWLWDVCWGWAIEDYHPKHVFFKSFPFACESRSGNKSVPFACESESGNNGDIVDDFYKLLVGDIGLGLMIFKSQSDDKMRQLVDLCKKAKANFRNGAKRSILIACYSKESQQFHYFDLSNKKT